MLAERISKTSAKGTTAKSNLCGITGKSTIKSVKTARFRVKYQHFFPFRTQYIMYGKKRSCPGWTIVNENGSDNKVVRHSYIPSPLIFMGHSVKPAIIQTPVTIDHIAPTLAHFMRIRAPNACTSAPITDLR